MHSELHELAGTDFHWQVCTAVIIEFRKSLPHGQFGEDARYGRDWKSSKTDLTKTCGLESHPVSLLDLHCNSLFQVPRCPTSTWISI
jgi:hypothetical protein